MTDHGQDFHTVAGSAETFEMPLLGGDPDGEGPAEDLDGNEDLVAAVGPGAGLPAAFVPTVAYTLPFSAAAPRVVFSWAGSATEGVDPARYGLYLTIGATTRPMGTIVVEGGPGASQGVLPLIGVADAREVTAGAIDLADRDAGDVLLALRGATRDLHDHLATRWAVAGGRGVDDVAYAAAGVAFVAAEGAEALAASHPAREFVAWRAMARLLFVPGAGEAADEYRVLRDEAGRMAARALGRMAVRVPGLGLIRMGTTSVEAVR